MTGVWDQSWLKPHLSPRVFKSRRTGRGWGHKIPGARAAFAMGQCSPAGRWSSPTLTPGLARSMAPHLILCLLAVVNSHRRLQRSCVPVSLHLQQHTTWPSSHPHRLSIFCKTWSNCATGDAFWVCRLFVRDQSNFPLNHSLKARKACKHKSELSALSLQGLIVSFEPPFCLNWSW